MDVTRVSRDRRALVCGLVVGALVLGVPLPIAAQAGRTVRVGVLRPAPDGPVFRQMFEPFRQALLDQGFSEGKNLTFDLRVMPGNAEELIARARELTHLKVDAIVAVSAPAVRAAVKVTSSVPIVGIDLESDAQAAGFARSLARPGGNVTGLFLDLPELSGKWIELLKEVVPTVTRMVVVAHETTGPFFLNDLDAAARALKVQLVSVDVREPRDLERAFKTASTQRAGAMLVLPSPVVNSARKLIADLAIRHRIPAIMPFAGFADDGGLMAYGPDIEAIYAQAGGLVAKVLGGIHPREIPIARPTRFELTVNLKAARALGYTVPQSMLLRASRVIE